MEGGGADDEENGDISSAKAEDGQTSLTSFNSSAKSPSAPQKCIGGVRQGAFSTGGGAHAIIRCASGTASTAIGTILFPLPLPCSFCEPIEEGNSGTTNNSRTNLNQFAPPC